MKNSKRYLKFILIASFVLTSGCSTNKAASTVPAPTAETEQTAKSSDLSGHTLMIYCGAGITKPFQEIADAFKAETGCEMQVTYANAGQIQSQIKASQTGDFFIAGSEDELKPVEEAIASKKPLVKHIPVLAVQSGNPKNITGLSSLADSEISLVLGDSESTPIGKISDKALKELGIFEKVNIISRTTTAPAIFMALSTKECDAVIVWKENANDSSVEIVNTTDLDKYIKTVPAAVLTYSSDKEADEAFLAFLDGDTAKEIWQRYGYELE
ncbi:MAG TPA: molybdate ABC transporter substrate-binding protein [Lachnospiraceae bacterium]|nr:molybdate ABC transporter substrate-binding protein [Lachnospiraceae bacterium]